MENSFIMTAILIVEDDENQRLALEEYFSSFSQSTTTVYTAGDAELALAVLKERNIDLVISDLMLPDKTGVELMRTVHKGSKQVPFLILTAQPTIESAVEAIQAGASDYFQKPVNLQLLKNRAERLLENSRLKDENKHLRARLSDTFGSASIIGAAPALQKVLDKVRQIAATDVTILLEGESGVGKEMFANLIHENSSRAGKPFIKVNCGALTKTILESELFGAVRGAYTGADQDRRGYFEAADGGTIFLDEIGEMDPESQIRLLRVLEEREVVRVGSTKAIKVNVRVVAATNKNLLIEMEEEKFREDLYYRLAVLRLHLPALRERKEDIPLLFNHFITRFNELYNKSVTMLAPDLLKFFQSYDWPGNVRQFRNVIEGMTVLTHEDVLEKKDLPEELQNTPARLTEHKLNHSIVAGIKFEEYEKEIIRKNLNFTGGNREKTATLLGISERTLYRKIKEFGI